MLSLLLNKMFDLFTKRIVIYLLIKETIDYEKTEVINAKHVIYNGLCLCK